MFKKRLKSIFKFKCPRCLKGEFFKFHPYDIKNVGKLHETCSNCGLKYEKEKGFYYGAMYVSYALGVALFVAFWVTFNLFFPRASSFAQITVISSASLILSPYLYALSKIIWANLFFHYEKPGSKDRISN